MSRPQASLSVLLTASVLQLRTPANFGIWIAHGGVLNGHKEVSLLPTLGYKVASNFKNPPGIDTKTECRCVVGGRVDGDALRVDEMVILMQQFSPKEPHDFDNRFFIVGIYAVFSIEDLGPPLSENYKMCVFIGLLLSVGILHTSYITLTTKWDNEAIERSWRARINGWVFEQQYVTSAVSEGDWDQGFEMEVM